MNKLKLSLEALAIESFDTTCTVREKGTVVGEQVACTCYTQCTCPGCPTCAATCAYTCDDATCPQCPTCADSCNGSCQGPSCWDTCGGSCFDTCRPCQA